MQTSVVRTARPSTNSLTIIEARVMTRCPTTNKLAIRSDRNPLDVPGGQAIWWYCSACKGWHVSVEDREES